MFTFYNLFYKLIFHPIDIRAIEFGKSFLHPYPIRLRGGGGLLGAAGRAAGLKAASLPGWQCRWDRGAWADLCPFLLLFLLLLLLQGDLRKPRRPPQHCQGYIGTRCQRGVTGKEWREGEEREDLIPKTSSETELMSEIMSWIICCVQASCAHEW